MPAAASLARARRSGRVYLTFDDGPDPNGTPAILAELARLGLVATFFVIAERARRHPELVRQALDEGHEVELHCTRHTLHTVMSPEDVDADTSEGLAVLRGIGAAPRRWRPPGGLTTDTTRKVARAHGLELVGWSVDPYDWRGDPVPHMLSRVVLELEPGSVFVLHDGVGPGALREDCGATAALIEPLTCLIRAMACEPAPLGEGPAFWWLDGRPAGSRGKRQAVRSLRRAARMALETRPQGRRPELTLEMLDEDDLGESKLAAVRELLSSHIPRHADEYAERGFRRVRPEFRTLAYVDGELIGTQSMFPIACDPDRRCYGLGDVVVRSDRRGHGVARSLVEDGVAECWRREVDIVLTDTTALRGLFMGLGFVAVPRFAFYYERDERCCWHPNWLAAVRAPLPSPRLRLAEGDF